MPIFEYKARRSNGDSVDGTLEANSREAIAERLQGQGLIPVSIEAQKDNSDTFLDSFKTAFQSKRVQLPDLVMFSRQMYSLTKAGVPLNKAIVGLIDTTHSIPLREALREILDGLTAGNDMTTCFSRHPHIFNSFYISLIHVGENSGRLDEAFRRLAAYLELEQENTNRIKSATRYPVIVFVLLIAAFTVINIFVIPALSGLFRQFSNDELPIFTRILLGTSEFFVNYWWLMLLVIIIGIVAWVQYVATETGRYWWDKKKLKIPVFGSIMYRALLARFARSFAMMSRSGVAITSALSVVSYVVNNKFVAGHVLDMRNGVERGESITLSAQKSGMFSSLVIQMLTVGEETGQLDEMLEEVADFYEREVDYDLKKLGDYIEPFLIVVVGIMVLILALGVFLPIWELASAARG